MNAEVEFIIVLAWVAKLQVAQSDGQGILWVSVVAN